MPHKHNVRLNAVGHLEGQGVDLSETQFERPVMLVYVGEFESMDGPVTITQEHIEKLVANHNALLSRAKRLATGEIPMKDFPPLQLDHSTSATHTVGRLVGNLSSGLMEVDGVEKLALFGTTRFLGRENVEKAKDGRYTHVSIGADLENGVLNELSVTPFPAAPRASLLSRGSQDKEQPMNDKLKKHLMDKKKLSAEDAEKLSKDILSHQKAKMGKSDEEWEKHLSSADDVECARMSDDHDTDMSKLAKEGADKEEEEEKKKSELTANREGFKNLALGVRKTSGDFRLALRKSTVQARLARLRSEAKVSPAELKKLDLAKLAGLDDRSMEACLATFDAREPMVRFGGLAGTNKGENIDKIQKKYRLARLEQESRMNMPSKRAAALANLKRLSEDEAAEIAGASDVAPDATTTGVLTKVTLAELMQMVDDPARHEELKSHLAHIVDVEPVTAAAESDAQMSSLAKSHAELQTKFEELIRLASPALGLTPQDLK